MRAKGAGTWLPKGLLMRRLPSTCPDGVLLSFDDGPTPGVTEGVLARLREAGARALFCVVGRRVAEAPALLRSIRDAGHLIGNHSHDHDVSRLPAPGPYLRDAERCSAAIAAAVGSPPRWFRPPAGRIHPASLVVPRRLGMRVVMWSVESRDWRCRGDDDARAVAADLRDEIGGRDIVLLHDYDTWIHTLLDELLPALTARGLDLAAGAAALDAEPGGRR